MTGGASAGYLRSGLPYNRFGDGTRRLVISQGLTFENKPQPGLATRMYNYPGMGHPAGGKQFRRDVLATLCEERK